MESFKHRMAKHFPTPGHHKAKQKCQAMLIDIKKSDILILMGDKNAKMGGENSNWETVMGIHDLSNMSQNGIEQRHMFDYYGDAVLCWNTK